MASTSASQGFESQKLFLYYFLMAESQKITWHYEGKQPNQGDFKISNTVFEAKSGVKDKNDKITISNKSIPEKVKKAILQLNESNANTKVIVTNHKIYFDTKGKGKYHLEDQKMHLLSDHFKNDFIFKGKTYEKKIYKDVYIFSIGVREAESIKELENKIFQSLKLYKYLPDEDYFATLSKNWRGYMGNAASKGADVNSARIVSYFASNDIILHGNYEEEDIETYMELIKTIASGMRIFKYSKKRLIELTKNLNFNNDKNRILIIEKYSEIFKKNESLLMGEIYDKKNWNT